MKQYRYTKYKTNNPLVTRLINGFYDKIGDILQNLEYFSLLDAGCGDAEALVRFEHILPANVLGIDNDEDQISCARRRLPSNKFEIQDIYHLTFDDNSFDLVLALETLEHLPHPAEALLELMRVSSKYLLISVPYEPFFMLGNFIRGKNISRFGNDLKHINHWSKRSLLKFLEKNYEVKLLSCYFPWLIALCSKYNR